MVKEMRVQSNPILSFHKNSHVFVKFAVCFVLVGLAFRLLFSDSALSIGLNLPVEPPSLAAADQQETESSSSSASDSSLFPVQTQNSTIVDFPGNNSQTYGNVAVKCDLFTGDWVPDPSGPRYTNESCHVMESHQNCMKNGRPDSEYFYWRWSPRDCELPKFNPQSFLGTMRNKSWAFIGDSISRNHVQSLLCILSQVHSETRKLAYVY